MFFTKIMKKRRLYSTAILASLVFLTWLLFGGDKKQEQTDQLVKIALREVGNRVLLANQDSTSLILPVVRLETNTYELSFEQPLTFRPNELVNAATASFTKAALPDNYRVETLNCDDKQVAYSYQMSATKEETIVPCAGRALTNGCYTIQVTFLNQARPLLNAQRILYLLFIVGFILLEVYFLRRKKEVALSENSANFSALGSYKFYPEQNKLVKEAIEIGLSKKECELLAIFIANPNQVIKRDELTKKVWEDNGVIVGRSLDTYISKLRKKLKDDKAIKLTNVHGVGYKLEINPKN
jgi:hypothetical protein